MALLWVISTQGTVEQSWTVLATYVYRSMARAGKRTISFLPIHRGLACTDRRCTCLKSLERYTEDGTTEQPTPTGRTLDDALIQRSASSLWHACTVRSVVSSRHRLHTVVCIAAVLLYPHCLFSQICLLLLLAKKICHLLYSNSFYQLIEGDSSIYGALHGVLFGNPSMTA